MCTVGNLVFFVATNITQIIFHLKTLSKLQFKCNLNVIYSINASPWLFCHFNGATRNPWAMNRVVFLSKMICNAFVLNRVQFLFSFDFYSSGFSFFKSIQRLFLLGLRPFHSEELVTTAAAVVGRQTPNTCQLFCQYNKTCLPCSACVLNAVFSFSRPLSHILARRSRWTRAFV